MTSLSLAQSYIKKAVARLEVLALLYNKGAYSDVVREAQEIVELCLKGMLRYVGIEPPKVYDVGGLLIEYSDMLSMFSKEEIERLAVISKRLRKERELSFYGDIDFIPTEEYSADDAKEAMQEAETALAPAQRLIK